MECPVYEEVKKKQDVIDEEVPGFVTESSSGGDTAQPDYSKTVMAFLGNIEAETRSRHAPSIAVLSVEERPVTPDQFTVEKLLQA